MHGNELQPLDRPTGPIDCNEAVDKAIHLLEVAVHESVARITREARPQMIAEEVPLTLLFQNLLNDATERMRLNTAGWTSYRLFIFPRGRNRG